MNLTGLIVFLVVGGVAGWLAGVIMKGKGFGIPVNIGLGIVGAVIGGFVLDVAGFAASGLLAQIISATLGAVLLLYLVRLLK